MALERTRRESRPWRAAKRLARESEPTRATPWLSRDLSGSLAGEWLEAQLEERTVERSEIQLGALFETLFETLIASQLEAPFAIYQARWLPLQAAPRKPPFGSSKGLSERPER